MADRIIISTEEMQAAVSAYEAQKQVKMDALSAMKSAVDNMDGSWDGPASEVFMAAFNSLYGKMLKTEEKMEDAIQELNGIITEADETEQAARGVSQGAEAMNASI
jgi:WXG100 family type VII secretion target